MEDDQSQWTIFSCLDSQAERVPSCQCKAFNIDFKYAFYTHPLFHQLLSQLISSANFAKCPLKFEKVVGNFASQIYGECASVKT